MARGGTRPGAGRPKGSKNKTTEKNRARLADLAQEYTKDALQTLVTVMRDDDAPHSAKVNAATAVLDRAHGKPVQTAEVTGKDGGPIQYQDMSEDQVDQRLADLLGVPSESRTTRH